jgi:tetratricopeptide (TPR) repeat protein
MVFGRLYRRPELQADPIHAHSDYLELLAEYGVVGAIAMAGFLLTHLVSGFRSISRLMTEELADRYHARSAALALQIGALSAVAAYLAHSAIDFNLHIPGNALFFAVIFGVLANPDSGAISALSQRAAILFRLALPALGIWMCASGLPKLRGEDLAEKARVAVRNRSYQEGIALATRARAAEPRNPEILFTLGDANHGLANTLNVRVLRRPFLQAAADAYRKGIELFPQDENMWVRLGQVLDGLREWRAADEAYRKAIALDPNLGILHAYYSAHLSAVGRAEDAQEQLTKARELGKSDFAALLQEASASLRF